MQAVYARVDGMTTKPSAFNPRDRVAANRGSSSTSKTLMSVRYLGDHARDRQRPNTTHLIAEYM